MYLVSGLYTGRTCAKIGDVRWWTGVPAASGMFFSSFYVQTKPVSTSLYVSQGRRGEGSTNQVVEDACA